MWQQPGAWGQQQWPLQQSAYANLAPDQVDWAALAKQWMQFRDAGNTSMPMQNMVRAPPPPPPPVIPQAIPPPNRDISDIDPSNWSDSWKASNTESHSWEETSGSDWKSDMDVQRDDSHEKPARKYQMPLEYSRGGYYQASQEESSSKTALHGLDDQYNNEFDFNQQNYDDHHREQYWSGPNYEEDYYRGGDRGIPSYNHNKGAQGYAGVAPPFHDSDLAGPSPLLDAAKRKSLPAWIREGLEKMEREKAKKEELERIAKEKEEKMQQEEENKRKADEEFARTGIPAKSKFEEDDEGNQETPEEDQMKKAHVDVRERPLSRSRSPTPAERYLTIEEKQQELMQKVKVMITEVLLAVTNEEIEKICGSVYNACKKKQSKAPAKMLVKSTALASLKNTFGDYDSELSDEESDGVTDDEASNSHESETDSSYRLEKRKEDFARKQRDRLRTVEHEEAVAMEQFNNPKQKENTSVTHGVDNHTSVTICADHKDQNPGKTHNDTSRSHHSESKIDHTTHKVSQSDEKERKDVKDSSRLSRDDSKDDKERRGHRSDSEERERHRKKSVSKEKKRIRCSDSRNKRSRDREQKSRRRDKKRSRSREAKRSTSKDRGSRSRERRRSRSKERRRTRSRERRHTRSRERNRSRSKEELPRSRKDRSRSRERRRSRSKESRRSGSRDKKHARERKDHASSKGHESKRRREDSNEPEFSKGQVSSPSRSRSHSRDRRRKESHAQESRNRRDRSLTYERQPASKSSKRNTDTHKNESKRNDSKNKSISNKSSKRRLSSSESKSSSSSSSNSRSSSSSSSDSEG